MFTPFRFIARTVLTDYMPVSVTLSLVAICAPRLTVLPSFVALGTPRMRLLSWARSLPVVLDESLVVMSTKVPMPVDRLT